MRRVWRGLRTVKPWVRRGLDVLDLFDWKAWIWYGLIGMETFTKALLVRAKRRGWDPGEVRLTKTQRFVIRPKRG